MCLYMFHMHGVPAETRRKYDSPGIGVIGANELPGMDAEN